MSSTGQSSITRIVIAILVAVPLVIASYTAAILILLFRQLPFTFDQLLFASHQAVRIVAVGAFPAAENVLGNPDGIITSRLAVILESVDPVSFFIAANGIAFGLVGYIGALLRLRSGVLLVPVACIAITRGELLNPFLFGNLNIPFLLAVCLGVQGVVVYGVGIVYRALGFDEE